MKKPIPAARVQGLAAPAPRVTKAAVFLLATALSIPVYAVLTLIEWISR
jgi:hypothetical protein